MSNIPLKTAIRLWTVSFQLDDDVDDIHISKPQYNRFIQRIKKYPNTAFNIMILVNGVVDKRYFDVGIMKLNCKWVVDKDKFLSALQEKKNMYRSGMIRDHFEKVLSSHDLVAHPDN